MALAHKGSKAAADLKKVERSRVKNMADPTNIGPAAGNINESNINYR
jgi:hypothetical protein